MHMKYKSVAQSDNQCGDVCQWGVVTGENLTLKAANLDTCKNVQEYSHAWVEEQDAINLNDVECAYRINERIDFMKENEFMF